MTLTTIPLIIIADISVDNFNFKINVENYLTKLPLRF